MSDAQTLKSAPAGEPTNEHIRADRACIGCGFNLYGQTVTKDPHYGLAIARCPECGQVAALQSYPTMSRWVNRFRALIALFWMFMILSAFALGTMITTTIVEESVNLASSSLAMQIGHEHDEWAAIITQERAVAARAAGTPPPAKPSTAGYSEFPSATYLTDEWIEQEYEPTLQGLGGVWKNLDKMFLFMLLPASIFALLLGIYWSVTLLGARRRTILWIPIAIELLAVLWIGIILFDFDTIDSPSEFAMLKSLPYVLPSIMGAQLIFAFLGVYLGRKIARFVICMSLPPRYRTSLSIFWTRDGLELPKPTLK